MSVNIQENLCRLCLNVVNVECEVIDEVRRNMIDFLRFSDLKADLDDNNSGVLCRSCADITKRSFHFKSTCLETEKCIRLRTVNNGGDIELKDLYKSKESVEEDSNICRLCLQLSQRCNFATLDDLLEDTPYIADLFSVYIPEVDLGIVKNPVICKTCRENLENYLSLTQKCCGVGGKVKTDSQNIAPVSINEVTPTANEWQIKQEEIVNKISCNEVILGNETIKTEEACDIKFEQVILNEISLENPSEVEEDTLELHKCQNVQIMYKCESCPYVTEHKPYLKRHMVTHEEAPETFNCIKSETPVKQPVQTPRNASAGITHKCPECSYETKRRYHLQQHSLIHRNTWEVVMYKCAECPYETKRKVHLKQHLQVHKTTSEIVLYKCTKCDYVTRHKCGLKRHVVVHKDPLDVETFKCTKCTYETKHKSDLGQHMVTHKTAPEVKLHKCTICTYSTKRRHNIKRHMLVHQDTSEVKTFKCAMCAYESKYKVNLTEHMLIHKNSLEVQMYKCELCLHETKYKRYLKRHMLTHKSRPGFRNIDA